MRPRAYLLGAILVTAFILPTLAAGKDSITIASGDSWPPFTKLKLPNKGFSNDIAKTVLERAGYEVTVEILPWNRAKKMTQAGQFDILNNVWYTDERAKTLAFTDPIARNEIVFITRKEDEFTYTGLSSLKGMVVGTVRGFDYRDAFLDADHFHREPAGTFKTNLKKLAAGRIDAAVGDRLIGKYLLTNAFPQLEGDLILSDKALSSRTLHVTVSRALDNTERIVTDFNTALEAIRADGTYAEIERRHGLQ